MKLKALLAALLVAGLAASIALASPSSDGSGSTTGTTATSTSRDDDHGDKHKQGEHKANCRRVELKGTVAAGSLSVAVTKANKAARGLVGGSATLSFSGKVSVKARMCTAAGSATPTLQLRVLKVEEHPAP